MSPPAIWPTRRMVGAFGAGLVGDLAVIMLASAVGILIFRRIHQPVVLGYLIAGMAVGPGSGLLPLGIDEGQIIELADLGVIFLLLFIGMEFDLRQLRSIGAPAILIGTFEVAAMLGIGFVTGVFLGLDQLSAVYLGGLLAISSTAVTIKILTDLKLLNDHATRLVFGVLVVEDFAAVIILSALSGTSNVAGDPLSVIGIILSVVIFFFATIFVGVTLVPRAFHRLERLASEEVLLIAAMGLCFGIALIATLLGFSPAMGAFLAGVVLGESGVLDSIRPRFEPIRDLFAAIFFVSVGMLIIPSQFLAYLPIILGLSLIFVLGKVGAAGGLTFLLGYGGRESLAVGTRLARTGEFSFIIGKNGLPPPGVDPATIPPGTYMNPLLYPVIAGVTLITTMIGPTIVKYTPQLYRGIAGALPGTLDQVGASYTAWISRARSSSKRDPLVRQKYRENGIRIFLTTVFLLIVSAASVAFQQFSRPVAALVGTSPEIITTAILATALGIVVVPVYVMIRLGKELVELTTQAAAGPQEGSRSIARAAVGGVVGGVIVVGVLSLLAVGLLPLVVAAGQGANIPILVAALVVAFSVAGIRVIRSARSLHARFESVFTAPGPVEAAAGDGPAPQRFSNLPRYMWAMGETETLAEYVVPEGSPVSGQALGDLRIRGRTGARVVAIQHGTDMQTAPPSVTRLHEGDLLLLVGTLVDLERFEVLLGRSGADIQDHSPG